MDKIKVVIQGEVTFKFNLEDIGDRKDLVPSQEFYDIFKNGLKDELEDSFENVEVVKYSIIREIEEVEE